LAGSLGVTSGVVCCKSSVASTTSAKTWEFNSVIDKALPKRRALRSKVGKTSTFKQSKPTMNVGVVQFYEPKV
jgi:hypothetical protein